MYSHAEAITEYVPEDDDLDLFIRIGSDYVSNYYEYSIPLKITDWNVGQAEGNESLRQAIWPDANRIDLELNSLLTVKQARNNNGVSFDDVYESAQNNGGVISIVGNLNLGNVKTIAIELGMRQQILQ